MKTTKKQFEEFKKEFRYWQQKLNCNDYKIYFFHKRLSSAYADIYIDESNKVATVDYSSFLGKDSVKEDPGPQFHAKHEAIHLLLYKLIYFTKGTNKQIIREWESVVRVLEKVL
jgi:hypothetical protein